MQNYIFDNTKDTSVKDFEIIDDLITTLKTRFTTYGYQQVRTSTFEYYDLYTSITGTVNKDEMIKVIDPSGNVLVMRPDVTIPITRMTALDKYKSSDESRLYYVLDVFRQSQNEHKERTQAGIEYFGENSPESDAEVIMLAIHTLKDLGFKNFKIEIGHAGFFKELIEHVQLSQHELEQLQTYIQSKNIAEIEPFLKTLTVEPTVRSAIEAIPLLYGDPIMVIQKAKQVIQNENMQLKLQNLIDVFDVLHAYGVEDYVVMDLGLINNMNYYSGIIFQGYVEDFGKPVLMGGRYNNLAEQFSDEVPAIGFAFEIDYLFQAMKQQYSPLQEKTLVDFIVYYDTEKQSEALFTAYRLREDGYNVLTYSTGNRAKAQIPETTIQYKKSLNLLIYENKEIQFQDSNELLQLIQDPKEDA
ncbi:ATP phosphoribosyltransferase regulatory subunit [Virgibacillus byunsanensis]|uniref:ATP phosphoribosyltransferase regulatory subunit n=1 Tax=Virgibacillus byunsanensis TaxID=570945 RepID=A0ABW3LJS8_9BACI